MVVSYGEGVIKSREEVDEMRWWWKRREVIYYLILTTSAVS